MKSRAIIIAVGLSIFPALVGAVEWNGRFGIGLRGPLFSPMVKGSDYAPPAPRSAIEPFMMGLGGELDLKYGFSKSFVLGLSAGYWSAYDDSAAVEDQSFKLSDKKNASAKWTAIPITLTGQVYFNPNGSIQPYILAGVGIDLAKIEPIQGGDSYSMKDISGRGGAGFNFWLGESFTLDIGGRFAYLLANLSNDVPADFIGVPDFGKPANRPFISLLETGIGLSYVFGAPKDTDQDGYKDKYDRCPDTPIGAIVDQHGCPLDSDADGVYDGLDKCAETPAGARVDLSGCPIDSDADGVYDGLDRCPETPAGAPIDAFGCPLDSDKDGVPDYRDQQQNTPAGAVVDSNGVAVDNDGDGVPDGLDKCPNTPAGVAVDSSGCPQAKPVSDKITLNINYQPNSVEPDEQAKKQLDELAISLMAYPDIRIEINGYTDALGSARTNLKISQERAEAILAYLAAKGIAADRMTAKGYGEDKSHFIADNDTPEGRNKNRRIEIVPVR